MSRFYTIEDEQYVSVTTVLNIIAKPELMFWYGKHGTAKCKEISTDALDFGSRVHAIIDSINKGNPIDYSKDDERVAPCIEHYKKWVEEVNFKPEKSEHTVFSKIHGFAGTLDCIGTLQYEGEEIRAIVDVKTSSAIFKEYELQLEAYFVAERELSHTIIDKLICIRLSKDGKIQVKYYEPDENMFEVFLSAKKLWEWKNKKEDKNETTKDEQ